MIYLIEALKPVNQSVSTMYRQALSGYGYKQVSPNLYHHPKTGEKIQIKKGTWKNETDTIGHEWKSLTKDGAAGGPMDLANHLRKSHPDHKFTGDQDVNKLTLKAHGFKKYKKNGVFGNMIRFYNTKDPKKNAILQKYRGGPTSWTLNTKSGRNQGYGNKSLLGLLKKLK